MSKLTQRKIVDAVITFTAICVLDNSGAGWWALAALPYGLWNYWDGMTRRELK